MTDRVAAPLGRPGAEVVGHRPRGRLRCRPVLDGAGQLHEPPVRRRPEPPPKVQLRVVEGRGVVLGDREDRRMVGLVALDDRRPRPVATPGPPDRLGQQLVGPLRGPLVGQVERDVRRDDADERDVRDVEALRDEARPDEHVDLAGLRTRRGPAPPHRAARRCRGRAGRPAAPGTARGPRARRAPCRRRGSGSGPSCRTGSATRAASHARSGGSGASSRPGGRRAAARTRGRPGRGRSPGTGRPTRSRGG